MKKPRTALVVGWLIAAGWAHAAEAQQATAMVPAPRMSRADEIALARRAGPAEVTGAATIWVLGEKGYELAQEGSSGWGCLVQRTTTDDRIFPRCDDAEIVAALYPTMFLMERMRAEGATIADYDRAVAAGYVSGLYRAPHAGAMSYMYADHDIPPHVMVAVPHCTPQHMGFERAEDMGAPPTGVTLLGVGQPDCMAIIFTPETTRRKAPPSN